METVANVVDGMKDTVIRGHPHAGIADLPAVIAHDVAGRPVVVSRWRPDEVERRRIAEGGDVYLWIFTDQPIPPVFVSGEAPIASQVQVSQVQIGLPTRRHEVDVRRDDPPDSSEFA